MSDAISNGPFKGRGPATGEIFTLLDRNGIPVLREGKKVEVWGLAHRTRHFLEVFPPQEGWTVNILATPGPVSLSDPETYTADGTMAVQPTMVFTATLSDKDGKIVATASSLRLMNGVSSWEAGESKARGRLYDALGLTTSGLFEEQDAAPAQTKATPDSPTKPAQAQPAPVHVGFKAARHAEKPSVDASTDAVSDAPVEAAADIRSKAQPESDSNLQDTPETSEQALKVDAAEDLKQNAKPAIADLNQTMYRQVVARAKVLGKPVPDFKSNKEMQEFHRTLLRSNAAGGA